MWVPKKCVCGSDMHQSKWYPDMYVCHRCGRKKPARYAEDADRRNHLHELIDQIDNEEVERLIRIVEDRY